MKSITACLFVWLDMSRHMKSVTLNGIVCIHHVHHTEHTVHRSEHPVHHIEHTVCRREHPVHRVHPTRHCVHRTLYFAHQSVKKNFNVTLIASSLMPLR